MAVNGLAQNLVPNPSFEDTVACPTADDQLYNCVGWDAFGSPDYFNACSSSFSVPNNWGGYQQAATGNAYIAIGTSGDSSFGYSCNDNTYCDSREYIGQSLSSPLTIGTKYFITVKTCLSISNTLFVNCAINKLGVLFSMSQPSFGIPNPTLIKNFAHVFSPSIITDSLGWTTISGSFIAVSAYQYVIVGNFFDDLNISSQIMDGNSYCNSYYFIDDVCVSIDSATCFSPTGINEILQQPSLNIYPNPANSYIIIDTKNIKLLQSNIAQLYNVQGKLINQFILSPSTKNSFNIQDISNGIYLLQLNVDGVMYKQKLIINH
jgi:type IX secretion system substrate protein